MSQPYEVMDKVYIMDHPLIQHKITEIRDKNTGTNEFRSCIEEIATLMGYEALRDLPLEDVEIETPIEKCKSPRIAGKKLAIVPRAGGLAARWSCQAPAPCGWSTATLAHS